MNLKRKSYASPLAKTLRRGSLRIRTPIHYMTCQTHSIYNIANNWFPPSPKQAWIVCCPLVHFSITNELCTPFSTCSVAHVWSKYFDGRHKNVEISLFPRQRMRRKNPRKQELYTVVSYKIESVSSKWKLPSLLSPFFMEDAGKKGSSHFDATLSIW